MIGQWGIWNSANDLAAGIGRGSFMLTLLTGAIMLAATPAFTQQIASPPAQVQPQPGSGLQPAPKKEGFFDALGRWWDESAADFKSGVNKMKGQINEMNERTAKAARDAAEATKEATEAIVKLPNTRIVEGRERCTIAPNGSPDCTVAAETICRGKGFSSGKSASIESARKCSARALLSRSDEDCVNETIVTRAACQ